MKKGIVKDEFKRIKKGNRERKNSVLKKKSKYKKCKLRRHTGKNFYVKMRKNKTVD